MGKVKEHFQERKQKFIEILTTPTMHTDKINNLTEFILSEFDSPSNYDPKELLKRAKKLIKTRKAFDTVKYLPEKKIFVTSTYINHGCTGDWTETEHYQIMTFALLLEILENKLK